MEELKYVKVGDYNSIIIFPPIIEHSKFRNFNPTTAGFCRISSGKVKCYGESFSLNLASNQRLDSIDATIQLFGIDAIDAKTITTYENQPIKDFAKQVAKAVVEDWGSHNINEFVEAFKKEVGR